MQYYSVMHSQIFLVIMPPLVGHRSACLLQKTEDILEFLKLPHMDLASRQVKIHKGELSIHIKNWDDVNKTLKGTSYEHFLQADY